MDKPKNRRECADLLKLNMPPLDHKHGYHRETAEKFAKMFGVTPPKLWAKYGVATAMWDRRAEKIIYYPEDICLAIRGAINKNWTSPSDWD